MKKMLLALLLALSLLALTACANDQEVFPVATMMPAPTQALSAPATRVPEPDIDMSFDFDDGSYDPSKEEGGNWDEVIDLGADATNAPVSSTAMPTVNSEYAGASPVPIDPIDKPTPTPLPALSFSTYDTYEATRLHVSFQAPSGWTVDNNEMSAYTITNPDPSVDFQAYVTVTAESVTGNYTTSQLTSTVNSRISAIKADSGFSSFSTKKSASRTLMDKNGIYNDFYGKLSTGAEVYGRVHAVCIERVLYTVTVVCPRGYWDTYKDAVYGKIRQTMIITR